MLLLNYKKLEPSILNLFIKPKYFDICDSRLLLSLTRPSLLRKVFQSFTGLEIQANTT